MARIPVDRCQQLDTAGPPGSHGNRPTAPCDDATTSLPTTGRHRTLPARDGEGGAGDPGDPSGADREVFKRSPTFGEYREAALAEARGPRKSLLYVRTFPTGTHPMPTTPRRLEQQQLRMHEAQVRASAPSSGQHRALMLCRWRTCDSRRSRQSVALVRTERFDPVPAAARMPARLGELRVKRRKTPAVGGGDRWCSTCCGAVRRLRISWHRRAVRPSSRR
jgi:hypothetical protein